MRGYKAATRDATRLAGGWRTYHHAMRRLLTGPLLALVLTACGLVPVGQGPPVPAGPLGPIAPGEAGAPPIECRGVPLEQCKGFASADQPDVVRWIITCTSVCTPDKGDVRIDILGPDGTTRAAGQGSYASGAAMPAPAAPPPASDPPPS